jgi:hypothetical protein
MTAQQGGREHLYRGLLRLYPADYRARFSDQMVQLFADQKRDVGSFRAWLRAPMDLTTTAIAEHMKGNRTVAHSLDLRPTPLSRVLGAVGVAGGVLLLLGYVELDGWTTDIFNFRLVLFNLGAIAVALASYSWHLALSRPLAHIAAAPAIIANAAYLAFTVKLVAQPGNLGPGDFQPLDLFILATGAMWLSDAWFGLMTLRFGVLNRWSALALMVGSVGAFMGMSVFGLAPSGTFMEKVVLALLALPGFAWILLGVEVAFRRRPAPPAAAG